MNEPRKHIKWKKSGTKGVLHEIARIGKPTERESRLVINKGWGQGGMEGNCLMHTGFPFGVMEMFWNWIKMIVAQYDEYSKCYWIIHVKMVDFMLCEFYFTKKKKKMDTVRLYLDFVDQGL